jgi:predicted small metal-binding protein
LKPPAIHFISVEKKGIPMAKVIHCNKVNPSSDCNHVVRGETEEEVLQKAAVHAREHGLEPTPELMNKVKGAIEDEPSAAKA